MSWARRNALFYHFFPLPKQALCICTYKPRVLLLEARTPSAILRREPWESMISKLNTQKPNTKRKLCTSEKLSMSDKKRSWLNQKGQGGSPTLKLSIFPYAPFVPTLLFPIMHPGGEVNFRKRGSKFSLPLSHHHQTLHVPLREVKLTKGGAHSPSDIPLPLPLLHTHTHAPNPWYTLEVKFT